MATGGGPQLTREGIARASKNEPKRAKNLPVGAVLSDSEVDGLPPVEALGVEEAKAESDGKAESKIEAALDSLWAEPNFDEDDDLPPPI